MFTPGNVFNADRDNQGKGIPIDNFLKFLENLSSGSQERDFSIFY